MVVVTGNAETARVGSKSTAKAQTKARVRSMTMTMSMNHKEGHDVTKSYESYEKLRKSPKEVTKSRQKREKWRRNGGVERQDEGRMEKGTAGECWGVLWGKIGRAHV